MSQVQSPKGWNEEKINDIIKSISLTGKKIKSRDYQKEGKIPIIDQGKELIGGFTDNSECKIHADSPLIIFGDHTRVIKYVDFDFAPGADGTKVLDIAEKIIPKYFYYYLKSLKLENKGYSRHFKILKQHNVVYPDDKNIQRKIVQKLDYILGQLEEKKKLLLTIKQKNENRITSLYDQINGEIITKYFESDEVKNNSKYQKFEDICIVNPSKSELLGIDENTEVSFIPMKAVDDIEGMIQTPEIRLLKEVKKGYTYFRENDVIFAKITPCMENGKAAIGKNLKNKLGFGSTEFHVLRPKDFVLPEWIYYFVRQNKFRKQAEKVMSGSAGQQRVPLSFIQSYEIPIPTIEIQNEIIEKIKDSKNSVIQIQNNIQPLFEQLKNSNKLLTKLANSILDQAFSGKLVN